MTDIDYAERIIEAQGKVHKAARSSIVAVIHPRLWAKLSDDDRVKLSQSGCPFSVMKESELLGLAEILNMSVEDLGFWDPDNIYFIDKSRWENFVCPGPSLELKSSI